MIVFRIMSTQLRSYISHS